MIADFGFIFNSDGGEGGDGDGGMLKKDAAIYLSYTLLCEHNRCGWRSECAFFMLPYRRCHPRRVYSFPSYHTDWRQTA